VIGGAQTYQSRSVIWTTMYLRSTLITYLCSVHLGLIPGRDGFWTLLTRRWEPLSPQVDQIPDWPRARVQIGHRAGDVDTVADADRVSSPVIETIIRENLPVAIKLDHILRLVGPRIVHPPTIDVRLVCAGWCCRPRNSTRGEHRPDGRGVVP
jgi:hypothetical protein